MFWADKIASQLGSGMVINDSKTPSGRVHVGSLRGVLIHDVVFKVLEQQGKKPMFLYGVDDYDPMDELSPELSEEFRQHMGKPLCDIPAPVSSKASNFAEFYIDEFFAVFKKLHVNPQIYYMSDYYRTGKMNESIEFFLRKKDEIRSIYLSVSGSQKSSDWYPLQVVCEKCGKIGSTKVIGFDGKYVQYHCVPKLVVWSLGCDYRGKISPFDGASKLPWKLEWVAKWMILRVGVEGAGKDHSSSGGSRDVSGTICSEIAKQSPPFDIPYEFFLTGKRKMSSSKGVGVSAHDIAEHLPAELLRFLLIRYQPQLVIDFDVEGDSIPKLYDEYDRCARAYWEKDEKNIAMGRAFELSQIHVDNLQPHHSVRFSVLAELLGIPGVDLKEQATILKKESLNQRDVEQLQLRIQQVKKWMDTFGSQDAYFHLLEKVPQELIGNLSETDKMFLSKLHVAFEGMSENEWLKADVVHQQVYLTAKSEGLVVKKAFVLIYQIFSGKMQGPRVGKLLSSLDRRDILLRLKECC